MGDQFWKYGFTAAHVRLGKICAAVKLHLRAKFACNPHHDTTVKLKKKFGVGNVCKNMVLATGDGSSSRCAAALPGQKRRHMSWCAFESTAGGTVCSN